MKILGIFNLLIIIAVFVIAMLMAFLSSFVYTPYWLVLNR